MQVTYIYNLFFYKLGGVRVKLNTQIFKLVLIFQARITKRLMRLMTHGETVFKNAIKHIRAGNACKPMRATARNVTRKMAGEMIREMAPPGRFERPTPALGERCSVP